MEVAGLRVLFGTIKAFTLRQKSDHLPTHQNLTLIKVSMPSRKSREFAICRERACPESHPTSIFARGSTEISMSFARRLPGQLAVFQGASEDHILNRYVRSESGGCRTEKQPTGRGPEGCDENGPAAVRRPVLIATKDMPISGDTTIGHESHHQANGTGLA
jgi:hypothetical protein